MGETRKCKVCEKTKPVELFYMYDKKKALYRRQCKECFRAMRKRGISLHRKHNVSPKDGYTDKTETINGVSVVLRQCGTCGEFKELKTKYQVGGGRNCSACIFAKYMSNPKNKKKHRDNTKIWRESHHGKQKQAEAEKKYNSSGKRRMQSKRRTKKLNTSGLNSETYKKHCITRIKHRAKKKDIPFELTWEDINIPDTCPVLGTKLKLGCGRGGRGDGKNAPSVDRLIPELGYVKENIRIISMKANSMKNNATLEEIESLYNWMKKELGKE